MSQTCGEMEIGFKALRGVGGIDMSQTSGGDGGEF